MLGNANPCSASCTVSYFIPLEGSRTLKGVSAHIKVTDGARVPGARIVADGARVRMDIATN